MEELGVVAIVETVEFFVIDQLEVLECLETNPPPNPGEKEGGGELIVV